MTNCVFFLLSMMQVVVTETLEMTEEEEDATETGIETVEETIVAGTDLL